VPAGTDGRIGQGGWAKKIGGAVRASRTEEPILFRREG
jgi:hypothetical protein